MRGQEEFKLSCVVADYLRHALPAHVLWSHFPAGENRSPITGARLKRMGTAKGWPDYIIVHNGRFIGIELKIPGNYPSPEQRAFGDCLTAQGGAWTVARSLDQVEAFLRAEGVPVAARMAA